jgi:hypothetical protein
VQSMMYACNMEAARHTSMVTQINTNHSLRE